jgi:hypothetical protein
MGGDGSVVIEGKNIEQFINDYNEALPQMVWFHNKVGNYLVTHCFNWIATDSFSQYVTNFIFWRSAQKKHIYWLHDTLHDT